MRVFLLIAAVAQVALAGSQFSVRMPFLNPAGVTYVNGPAHSTLAAGPAAYGATVEYPGAAHVGYAGAAHLGYAGPAHVGYAGAAHVGYAGAAHLGYAGAATVPYPGAAHVNYAGAAPLGYAAQYGPGPLIHAAAPAPLAYAAHQTVGYAHARVPAVAAVPTVHHVPGVAEVPVTRVQANHGVIQKLVDVAHPATATRKFQVRRPAIQKQFYDIEERVVVRNAGSALVELEEPLSKTQKGPTVIARHHPYQQVVAPVAPVFVSSTPAPFVVQSFGPSPAPIVPVPAPQSPIVGVVDQQPLFIGGAGQGQAPFIPSQGPGNFQQDSQDDDSVVVENTDFAARSRGSTSNQQRFQQQQQQIQAQQMELQARQQQLNSEIQQEMDYQSRQQQQPQQFQARQQQSQGQQQQFQGQQEQNFAGARSSADARFFPSVNSQTLSQRPSFRAPSVDVRSNGAPLDLIPQSPAGPSVVPSLRSLSPEVNQANQQRLIQLLTAQGGVTEVGLGRSGPAGAPVGDAGPVRARVLSATPAPRLTEPAGERVSTRRVVVSRPIETLQEFDVIEPATKLERVAVNHPTVYKTLHHDIARVPTSVPVYGKALAHTYADTAVPVGFYHH